MNNCTSDVFVQIEQDLIRIPCLKCTRHIAFLILYKYLPRVLAVLCTNYITSDPPRFVDCECGKPRLLAKKLPGHDVRFIKQVVTDKIYFPEGSKINRSSYWLRCLEDYSGVIVMARGNPYCLHAWFCKLCKAPRVDSRSSLCASCWQAKKQMHLAAT